MCVYSEGYFTKTADDISTEMATVGCADQTISRNLCIHYCLNKRAECAGIHYDNNDKLCCLLNDDDLLNPNRFTHPNSELWQWTDDVELCRV